MSVEPGWGVMPQKMQAVQDDNRSYFKLNHKGRRLRTITPDVVPTLLQQHRLAPGKART